jgi:hypothetical protein
LRVYTLPPFLEGRIPEEAYVRWLRRKCTVHVKRDRKRSAHEITGLNYRSKMHAAVCASHGRDFYTGEELAWELIGTYSNEESKDGRSHYKAGMAMLPTVDHVLMEDGSYDFVVCAWRTNDAKNDLSHAEFVDLCRRVIAHEEKREEAVTE